MGKNLKKTTIYCAMLDKKDISESLNGPVNIGYANPLNAPGADKHPTEQTTNQDNHNQD